ncbi:hypothetical protein ACWGJB_37265 [Streptomyces sp. NPDC054813]
MGDDPVLYEIRLAGHLGPTLLTAFPAFMPEQQGAETVLTGLLPDTAALFGVLSQIESLGLELLEVRKVRTPLVHSLPDRPGTGHPGARPNRPLPKGDAP